MKTVIHSMVDKIFLLDHCICIILAFMFTSAPYYINEDSFSLSLKACIIMLVYYLLFLVSFCILRDVLSIGLPWNIIKKDDSAGKDATENHHGIFALSLNLINHKYSIWLLALIMFIIWLPTLISLYPGTAINDTWGELVQFINMFQNGKVYVSALSDHHPVVDTFIMGQIIVPISKVTGSWQIAFFIYVLLQTYITCLAFSYVLKYLYEKLKIGIKSSIAVFFIFSLFPIFPVSAQTISKDAIFSCIYVLFCVNYVEIVRTKGAYLNTTKHGDLFIILCLACCLTKKVGFYVICISIIIAAIILHKGRKQLLISALSCIILMKLFLPLAFSATGITPGGIQEMFSLPFQMTARYVREFPDDITQGEEIILEKVLDMEDIENRYDPLNADPVRRWTQLGEKEDYVKYIWVWMKQGFRHPKVYLDATLAMESGWFSWTKYMPLMDMDWHNVLDPEYIPEETTVRKVPFSITAHKYIQLTDFLYKIPGIKVLFTYGLYTAWMPAFIISSLIIISRKRKDYSWLVAFPMSLSLFLGCWLAPLAIYLESLRYVYPLTYTLILNLAWCRYCYREDIEESDKYITL